MQNAHLRLGLLEYHRITEKTSARIRVRVASYIGEDEQAHLIGVFGQGDDRHIARWRSVKHVTTFVEHDEENETVHHREQWANELRLVYADGRTLKLTETPIHQEEDADAECAPAARAA